jgi:hypothetical protein
LNGAALPGPPQGVLDVQIDFGPVKGAITLVDAVFLAVGIQRRAEAVGGLFPLLVGADGFFRPGGQLQMKTKTEFTVYPLFQPQQVE